MPVAAGLIPDPPLPPDDVGSALADILLDNAAAGGEASRPPAAVLDALRGSGVLGAAVPVEHGGLGGDATATNRIVTQVARRDPSTAIVLFQHFAVTARLVEHGTTRQRSALLPRLASGDWIAASAWSENGAGAAKQNIGTTAARQPDGSWLLNGVKSFVTGTGLADVYLVLAQSGDKNGEQISYGAAGQSLFLVEAANPGLAPGPALDLLGMRSSATGSIRLDRCRVSADDLLGQAGEAARIIAGVRESGATLGAVSLGIAEAAYAQALAHARKRGQLDDPITRNRLVDLATQIEAIRAVVERAGRRDADQPGMATLQSKLFASLGCETVLAEAGHLIGSSGYLRSHPVNQLAADARAVALMGPTNDLCRQLVGAECLT